MSARRPLPEALDRAIGLDPGENLGLWLDRFLERDGADWSLTGEQRREALGRYARRWSRPAAAAALARRLDGVRVWAGDGPPPPGAGPVLRRFEARLAGRMVPGMSSGTPTELGLSLDRLYGAPRLPGSGLRGLARAWAETEGSGWWEPDGSCPRLEAAFGWGP